MLYVTLYFDLFTGILDFYIICTLFSTLMVIFAANAVYSVLFLIGTFLLVGFIFILLGVEYLGLVYMIVYIGAIAILFLFILMLLDLKNLTTQHIGAWSFVSYGMIIFFLAEGYQMYINNIVSELFFRLSPITFTVGSRISLFFIDSLSVLSPVLYNMYTYYIIACGFILLVVMLGVVVLLTTKTTVPFGSEKSRLLNKYLVESQKVVRSASFKNGL